jgi:hypothetical protein
VRALLATVPVHFEVALAVALPKGSRLPPQPTAAGGDARESFCPKGLSQPAAGEAEGDLSASALRDALTPLRAAAATCAASSGGRAVLGGRMSLSLRIGADGRVREACISRDEIGEAMLRRCIAESARELVFPTPDPAGSVDVELPLDLALEGPAAQRPLCD